MSVTALLSSRSLLRSLRSALLFGLVGALLALAAAAPAQRQMGYFGYPNSKDTRVVVESIFDGCPTNGYLPVRVTITSAFPEEHVWRMKITASHRDYRSGSIVMPSEFEFTAPPKSVSSHTVLVPIPPALYDNDNSISFSIEVTSRGLRREETYDSLLAIPTRTRISGCSSTQHICPTTGGPIPVWMP